MDIHAHTVHVAMVTNIYLPPPMKKGKKDEITLLKIKLLPFQNSSD